MQVGGLTDQTNVDKIRQSRDESFDKARHLKFFNAVSSVDTHIRQTNGSLLMQAVGSFFEMSHISTQPRR